MEDVSQIVFVLPTYGPPPFGLPPIGLPPIGLPPFGLTPIGPNWGYFKWGGPVFKSWLGILIVKIRVIKFELPPFGKNEVSPIGG